MNLLLPVAKFIAEYLSFNGMWSAYFTSCPELETYRRCLRAGCQNQYSKEYYYTDFIRWWNRVKAYSEVVEIPSLPISFEQNAVWVNCWEVYDKHLPLEEIKQKYQK